MAQKLNQVPPDLQVWEVAGLTYLVRFNNRVSPPVPLVWEVENAERREALGIQRVDRRFDSVTDFYKTGAVRAGSSLQLWNTTVDPLEDFYDHYADHVLVNPWLKDPEVLSLFIEAAMENREVSETRLSATDWWRTHTDDERQWLALNASDPATADRLIEENRARVADMFRQAGIDNARQKLIDTVADKWTTGAWSRTYTANQIRLLADPNLQGTLDPALSRRGVDTTREGEGEVRDMVETWLGPGHGWTDKQISVWASRLREDTDARLELKDTLSRHRRALFPEYENANLTYEDIAAPWRNVFQQQWGQLPDETDALFQRVVRLNDRAKAERVLREEGLKRGNQTIAQRLLSDLQVFGGQVRRSDPAVV